MKFLVFFFIVGCALAHNVHRRAADEQNAEIKEQNLEINPDGNFNFNYETSNGIQARALGTPKEIPGNPPEVAENIQGSFQWTSPEGKTVVVEYTADETGYHPKVRL